MKRAFTTSVLALLLALGLTPLTAGGAVAATNTVTITISGGDATALATCLNVVKKGNKVKQKNKCDNVAYAKGGDVILKNVSIFIVQTNDADGDISDAANTVDLTITGGDATALAACVNAVKDGNKVKQKNKCKNTATAEGGDVILKNVDITIIQENV
ncbi:MAG: hypothetical protein QOJ59_4865 [Thermomicrobiales bacterium]|jgi:hypothetical protein|nr:hypothetical protein [Thermomicrobiales bacterium]